MRILYVTPYLPHIEARHAGGKLGAFVVHELARRHEVVIVARCLEGDEERVAEVRQIVYALHLSGSASIFDENRPASAISSLRSLRTLARRARGLLEEGVFDVVQVEHSEVGFFWRRHETVPAFLTCHDVVTKPARRRFERARGGRKLSAWLAWRILSSLERRAIRRFSGVFTLSEVDSRWARDLVPGVEVTTLRHAAGVGFEGLERSEVDGSVGFLGTLYRQANSDGIRWFLEGVWPLVLEEYPHATFTVAGVGASEDLERRILDSPRCELRGEVENVESFYKSCSVFVAPVLVGGGIIVKVLDGLAAGAPVVTTPRGNEGIGAIPGRDVLVAESASQFASAVSWLLEDAPARRTLGDAGRRFVAEEFSGEKLVAQLENSYRSVRASI